MAALRNPQSGCPWDIRQTHQSISAYPLDVYFHFGEEWDDEWNASWEEEDEEGPNYDQ